MSYKIKRVEYFYCTVEDQPGEAYKLLSQLANVGINLLAFTAIPIGPIKTQLTIFPEDPGKLTASSKQIGLTLDGPNFAFLVQGDDALGAFAQIHELLYNENVNVYACNGVTDDKGGYGYILYVRPEQFNSAAKALKI